MPHAGRHRVGRLRRLGAGPAAALALAVLAACGGGSGASGTRTVKVEMHDIGYRPDHVRVKAGEKVTFVFRNAGKIVHDAFLGDEQAQEAHEQEMRDAIAGGASGTDRMGGAGDGSDGGMHDGITVQPGATGEIVHTFAPGDRLVIGCHETGHYAAGMKLSIEVT